jgi:hypothetical protein
MAKRTSITRKELEERVTTDLHKALHPPVSLSWDTETEVFTPYHFQFRSSKLPFCKREFVIHSRLSQEQRAVRGESYSFTFYVKIGSAVHEVVQRFLGISKFLYGNWTCCGVTEYGRQGSAKCQVCGSPQQYSELAPKSELGMHVDGISVLYNGVAEFKTTSSKNLPTLSDPYPQHMGQASCYLHALNAENDWELDKLIFIYFSRDNPKDFRVFVRAPLATFYDESLGLWKEAKEALYSGVLPDPICTSSSDGSYKGCSYAGICFSPSLEEKLLPVESLVRHGT